MTTIYTVLLTKMESTHNNLRTDSVEGKTLQLPVVGENFRLIGKSLTEGPTYRAIETSQIAEVVKDDDYKYTFKTANSTYKLSVIVIEKMRE